MDGLDRFWCWLVVLVIPPLCTQASYGHPRQESDGGSGSTENVSNSTSSPPAEPILSGGAIANIICGILAVTFLTCYLCFLMYSFNKNEHKSRVRTALENNRRIDEQIAKAKARAAAKQGSQLLQNSPGDNLLSSHMASPKPLSTGVNDAVQQFDSGSGVGNSAVGSTANNREALGV